MPGNSSQLPKWHISFTKEAVNKSVGQSQQDASFLLNIDNSFLWLGQAAILWISSHLRAWPCTPFHRWCKIYKTETHWISGEKFHSYIIISSQTWLSSCMQHCAHKTIETKDRVLCHITKEIKLFSSKHSSFVTIRCVEITYWQL